MMDYKKIYKPRESANNCCFSCKKSIDGCAWSRDAKPVDGWEAVPVLKETYYAEDTYKILYCPEFEEGDAAKDREWDEDHCMDLIEAVYRNAADDFKKAYKQKLKLERQNAKLYKNDIANAESVMHECSFLLGEWTEKLKRMVEKELSFEEGGAYVKEKS